MATARPRPSPARKAVRPPAAPAKAKPVPAPVTAPVPAAKASKPARPAKAAVLARPGKVVPAAKPVKAAPVLTAPAAAPIKARKPVLVRDSFTMPEVDFGVVATLKKRAIGFARPAKKSELLRAGLHALAALDDAQLMAALEALLPIKSGRPKKA